MLHVINGKSHLVGRVRRINGPIAAVEWPLESETGCAGVLTLISPVRGAANGLLEDQLHHAVHPAHEKDPEKASGAADLIGAVRTCLK
jgi:DNA-binding FrmR family transcriptional regulator